jgi:hypothetical protein
MTTTGLPVELSRNPSLLPSQDQRVASESHIVVIARSICQGIEYVLVKNKSGKLVGKKTKISPHSTSIIEQKFTDEDSFVKYLLALHPPVKHKDREFKTINIHTSSRN